MKRRRATRDPAAESERAELERLITEQDRDRRTDAVAPATDDAISRLSRRPLDERRTAAPATIEPEDDATVSRRRASPRGPKGIKATERQRRELKTNIRGYHETTLGLLLPDAGERIDLSRSEQVPLTREIRYAAESLRDGLILDVVAIEGGMRTIPRRLSEQIHAAYAAAFGAGVEDDKWAQIAKALDRGLEHAHRLFFDVTKRKRIRGGPKDVRRVAGYLPPWISDSVLDRLLSGSQLGAGGGRASVKKSIPRAILDVLNEKRRELGLAEWRRPEDLGLVPRRKTRS